jgi:SET domain
VHERLGVRTLEDNVPTEEGRRSLNMASALDFRWGLLKQLSIIRARNRCLAMDQDETDSEGERQIIELLAKRGELTEALYGLPYDLILYIERATVHSDLGYPDLAAGDAYRALLLTDEVCDESFDYHEKAVEALRPYSADSSLAGLQRLEILHIPRKLTPAARNGEDQVDRDLISIIELAERASIRCYQILAISLLLCGCLKSAYEFSIRGLAIAPSDEELLLAQEYIQKLGRRRLKVDSEELDISNYPDEGLVRREVYPWNNHEPDRFSQETLDFLNAELGAVAPKCVVRVTELPTLLESESNTDDYGIIPTNKQLGLFAKEDITPGELVLDEYSILSGNNRLKASLCDACSSVLPELGAEHQAIPCPECDDTMFCSERCYEQAMTNYHPAVCEKDLDTVSKDPLPNETSEALYLLLLARALAMSITRNIHPLNLKEVKYIWGDFLPSSTNAVPLSPYAGPPPIWTLPFSFATNVSGPLHILGKMDIDIFASLATHDLWIFNTLYAKFRGTASARISALQRTGGPEVAAVHPLWCLANHDCDPNVKWEWGGRMHFYARKKRIRDSEAPGIRAGEEVLSHYCDIDLPVHKRREWARGSLGGWCMCGRCRSEAATAEEGMVNGLDRDGEQLRN